MSQLRWPALPGLVVALAAGAAAAQGIDMSRGGPIDVTSTDGIEWRQQDQVVVARGNARAVRDNVSVDADRLLARYRPAGGAAATPAQRSAPDSPTGGNNEIWRLEAEGQVKIYTASDTARGDRAVYDVDQAVLVLTGRNLSLATPTQTVTARDSLEYWSMRRMAVARGNAVAVDTQENRRIGADTLVSYFVDNEAPQGAAGATPANARRPARAAAPAAQGQATGQGAGQAGGPIPGAGRVDRVEAFGNVEIRTITEVVRGDRGVYSPATGMARLLGNVRITRGDNQINGREAIVNLRTGVARLVSAPGNRVQGLVVPQQDGQQRQDPLLAPRGAPGPQGARQ